MEEKIFDFINATFGTAFAVTVVVLGFAFWLTYWITKKVTTINTEHGSLNKNIEKIEHNIDEMRKDISHIKGEMDMFKTTLVFMKNEIDIFKNNKSNLMQSHSPISLTKKGKEVAEELKAEEIISKNWESISVALLRMDSQNPYDIQTFCIERADVEAEQFFDVESIDRIKRYAFEKGESVHAYYRLLGLLIRDRYFKENGIPLTRIDENDPNKAEK